MVHHFECWLGNASILSYFLAPAKGRQLSGASSDAASPLPLSSSPLVESNVDRRHARHDCHEDSPQGTCFNIWCVYCVYTYVLHAFLQYICTCVHAGYLPIRTVTAYMLLSWLCFPLPMIQSYVAEATRSTSGVSPVKKDDCEGKLTSVLHSVCVQCFGLSIVYSPLKGSWSSSRST